MMQHLSRAWSACAPAVANHLWQSTVFLVLVALVTLALRQNHARARHALWVAASAKFLLPFSLLVAVGSYFSWVHAAPSGDFSLYLVIDQAVQPFQGSTAPQISQAAAIAVVHSSSVAHVLPAVLIAIWFCGFAGILVTWCIRWGHICRCVRESQPLRRGREIDSLRRVQRAGGGRRDIEIRLLTGFLEPGIFGIFRATLLWPEGVSEQLSDGHLDAIIAHEVSHVRRRDNLAAAVHMLVQAIFWFHPLVWCIGARLVEERERACDQDVLDSGVERRVYAESIVKICEFCLQSPVPCISGVTGADLKQRIAGIMSHGTARKLDLPRKLVLVATAFAVSAVPIALGLANGSRVPVQSRTDASHPYQFEVASIKPDKSGTPGTRMRLAPAGFSGNNVPIKLLVRIAFDVQDNQIIGAPAWLGSDYYDIEAKIDGATVDTLHQMSEEDALAARRQMLQALLADRMRLVIHRETREQPLYEMVIAKGGSKLHEATPGDTYPNGIKGPDGVAHPGMMSMGRGGVMGQAVPISNLTDFLTQQLHRIVIDKTGLTGNYDFTMHWTPVELQGRMFGRPGPGAGSAAVGAPGGATVAGPGAPASGDNSSPDSGPTIFTAIQEQLGLTLESSKGPVEVIVIDHVERPSEN